jgi:hypothetical protein
VSDDLFTTINFPYNSSISSFFTHGGEVYVQGSSYLGKLKNNTIERETRFYTNGERSTYDPSGFVWAYPNRGNGTNGAIAMLSLEKPHEIHRIITQTGIDHYENNGNSSTGEELFWSFDQYYHFNHVIPIPNNNSMMVAVSEGTGDFAKSPHTLEYSHTYKIFKKIFIPNSDSKGIKLMASDGSTLYGIAEHQMYKLENSQWVKNFPLKLRGDFRDMIIVDSYAIIGSGWRAGDPGIEIINLETGMSKRYNADIIPLPTDAVLSLAAQRINSNSMKIWFGTNDGLAYCDVSL